MEVLKSNSPLQFTSYTINIIVKTLEDDNTLRHFIDCWESQRTCNNKVSVKRLISQLKSVF